jgi:hypothetical protein
VAVSLLRTDAEEVGGSNPLAPTLRAFGPAFSGQLSASELCSGRCPTRLLIASLAWNVSRTSAGDAPAGSGEG